jgi:hypothetical protein
VVVRDSARKISRYRERRVAMDERARWETRGGRSRGIEDEMDGSSERASDRSDGRTAVTASASMYGEPF